MFERLAPQVGLEPTTLRLTAGCSAIELLRSVETRKIVVFIIAFGIRVWESAQRLNRVSDFFATLTIWVVHEPRVWRSPCQERAA